MSLQTIGQPPGEDVVSIETSSMTNQVSKLGVYNKTKTIKCNVRLGAMTPVCYA